MSLVLTFTGFDRRDQEGRFAPQRFELQADPSDEEGAWTEAWGILERFVFRWDIRLHTPTASLADAPGHCPNCGSTDLQRVDAGLAPEFDHCLNCGRDTAVA